MTEPRLLVIGRNGEGKSNLLEAVELLTSLRSHRCSHDRDLIRHGHDGSRLRAGDDEGDGWELRLRRELSGCSISISAPQESLPALLRAGFVVDPGGIRAMGLRLEGR